MQRKLRTVVTVVLGALALLGTTVITAPEAVARSVDLCMFAKPRSGETALTAIKNLESKIGRRFDMRHGFYRWESTFPGTPENEDEKVGRIPIVDWIARRSDGTWVPWKEIAAGLHDSVIEARADAIKAWGNTIYVSFHHEPENDPDAGTPAEYAEAFRHIRHVFEHRGAFNVRWLLIMMSGTFDSGKADNWFAGAEYADFIGVDGYNWYPGHSNSTWRSFASIFRKSRDWAIAAGKPLVIAEAGVQEDPADPMRKANWFRDALTTLKSWPEVKSFCYFHSNKEYPWWIDSSQASLDAYAEIGADAYLGGTTSSQTEGGAAPAPPKFSSTNPASPANENFPRIKGTAPSGTTVDLYTNATCTSEVTASGTAADFSSPGLAAGVPNDTTTTFYGTATDTAGLVSACSSSSITYIEDSTPPPTPSAPDLAAASDNGHSNTDNLTNDTTPTFTGTAEPGTRIGIYVDGVRQGSATATSTGAYAVTTNTLSAGSRSIAAQAADAAGNESAPSDLLRITIDTTAPGVRIDSKPPNPATDPNLRFAFSSGDAQATFTCSLSTTTASFSPCSSPKTYGPLSDGSYVFQVRATDPAGNVSGASYSFTLDATPPAAPSTPDLTAASDTGVSNTDDVTNDVTPTFTGTAEAGGTVEILVDGTPRGSGTASGGAYAITTTALAEGALSVKARVTDSSGHVSGDSGALELSIDLAAPGATIDSKPPDPTTEPNPQFAFSSADAGATFECSMSSGAASFSVCTSPKAYGPLANGTYTFQVRATDAAGNTGAAASYTFTVSAAPPPAPSTPDLAGQSDTGASTNDNLTTDTTPTFTGTAGVGTVEILVDGTVKGSATASGGNYSVTTSALTPGAHSITARLIDAAGNASAASSPLNVHVDTVAPTASATPTGGTYTTAQSVTLAATDSGGPSSAPSPALHYTTDGSTPTTASTPYAGAVSISSTMTLKFIAVDAAGNQSGVATETYTINTSSGDTAPPVATAPRHAFILNGQLSSTTVPIRIRWSATDDASGIASYRVQQSSDGGGTYSDVVLPTATTKAITRWLTPGTTTYRFRVQATDGAGNMSAWAEGPAFTLAATQDNSSAVAYAGTWSSSTLGSPFGGTTRHSSAAGGKASFTFTGSSFAWVASRGPDRGIAEVWIDGTKVAAIDLYASAVRPRRVVLTRAVTPGAAHTVEVRVTGTRSTSSTGTRVDVDAFVVIA